MLEVIGYPPRLQAYLIALDLSEAIQHVRGARARRAALDEFADEVWSLVGRLDRFAAARSTRNLSKLQETVAAIVDSVPGLGIEGPARALIESKLAGIRAALDAVALAEEERRQRLH